MDNELLVYIHTTKYIEKELFMVGLGKNKNNFVPVTIKVKNWKSELYVKKIFTSKVTPISKKSEILNLKNILEKNEILEYEQEYIELNKFFGYSEEKELFHKITFRNYQTFLDAKKVLKQQNSYVIAEHLNDEEMFFLTKNLKQAQWVVLNMLNVSDADFGNSMSERNPLQFSIDADEILSYDGDALNPPEALIATIDAETYSSKDIRPNPTLASDVLYCMSVVFSWSGSSEAISKYCIIISDIKIDVEDKKSTMGAMATAAASSSTTVNDDIIVICVKNERELFEEFSKLINRKDPDCINGYNTMGYDFMYMNERTKVKEMSNYSRIKLGRSKQHYNSMTWEGAGGRYHSYTFPVCYGRIILDTFLMAAQTKTDPGIKGSLQSHKLDDVGEFFVGEKKEDLPYKEQFRIYREFSKGNRSEEILEGMKKIVTYCVQDSNLTMKVFHKLNGWVGVREKASIMFQDMSEVTITGMQKKYKAQIFRECKQQGYYIIPMKNNHKFRLSGGYVNEPLKGFHKNVTVADFSGMYPSIMMGYNLCPSTFSYTPMENSMKVEIPVEVNQITLPAEYEVPEDFFDEKEERIKLFRQRIENLNLFEFEEFEFQTEMYVSEQHETIKRIVKRMQNSELIYILQSESKMRKMVPEVFDFDIYGLFKCVYDDTAFKLEVKKKLIASKIDNDEMIKQIMTENDYSLEYKEAFQNLLRQRYAIGTEPNMEKMVVYFNQKRKGIVPLILEKLKMQRKFYKGQMKKSNDPVMKLILDQRQNGIKILMNSIYGCYGTVEGNYGFLQGSAAITYFGRTLIQKVNVFLEKKGYTILYNDTDSVMFNKTEDDENRHNFDAEELERVVKSINEEVLEGPIEIELEKIMDVVFLKKKKYFGNIKYADGKHLKTESIFTKGVEAVRGDVIPFTRILYRELVRMILLEEPFEKVYQHCRTQLEKLKSGQVDRNLLSVSKTLAQNYASESAPLNVYAKWLVSQGERADPGTKISFIVTKQTNVSRVSETYRPVETQDEIDFMYYYNMAVRPLKYLLERLSHEEIEL